MGGREGWTGEDQSEGPELATPGIGRRDFLRALAAMGAATTLPGILACDPEPGVEPGEVFPDGVKAGDPERHGSVIWTRVAPRDGDRRVLALWLVAEDAAFHRVVRGGIRLARAASGHTVKVPVRGLRPDRWYHYRFYARGVAGPVGRLRTAPDPESVPDHLRYAFASCQQRNDSFYIAHRAIANEGVDFLMHLGDYIYAHDFADLTVEDYRQRYRIFHSNPWLQELHAAVPLVPMWDDGEFYNGLDREGPRERLEAARRAWFENMPVLRHGHDRVYRSFPWGRLARVFMIDVRSYRDPEVPANVDLGIAGLMGQDSRIPPGEQMFDPARTTLGERQKRWLGRGLRRSRAQWRLIGNPYNMHPWKLVDLDTPEARQENPDLQRNAGIYASNEAWDDYQAERRELLELIRDRRIENVVFTTGHAHVFIASELQPDFDDPASPTVAFDFVTGSLTADPDPLTVAPETLWHVGEWLILNANHPYLKYVNLIEQGYGLVDVTPEELVVRFRTLNTFDPNAAPVTRARFRVASGSSRMEVLPAD